jgi:hypothetical protein
MTLIKSDAIANAERRPINIGASDVEYRLKSFSGIHKNIPTAWPLDGLRRIAY